jgi:type 1 glutamine amidotransferase
MRRSSPFAIAALAALALGSAAGPARAADTTPPVLADATLTPVGPAQYGGFTSTGNSGWYTNTAGSPPHGSVTLHLSATDDDAVAKFQISLDNGATYTDVPVADPGPPATAAAEITQEGNTTVRYRAVDASGNVSVGATASTTLSQAADAGATGVRLASTRNRAAGDTVTIGSGADQETVEIASIPFPPPASPSPNVLLAAPLANAHASGAAVVATALYRTISVRIDTQAPSVGFPAGVVVDNRIGHSATVTPTRTDPSPGSGGTAVLETWLDGKWVYPLPLDASQLSLGRHTWALRVGDVAGNGAKVTLTFLVTTSFADIDALLTRYQTAGSVPADTVAALRTRLAAARDADAAGDQVGAIASLEAFVTQARGDVPAGDVRDLLAADAQDVIRQERGLRGPDATGLGVTTEPSTGAAPHPLVTPAAPAHNPGAKFKVLVISNRSDGFRHESIEDDEALIQDLGRRYGFDVDIWDYMHPDQSLPDTPFTSAADLAQYKVIVGDSSVGNNTFRTNYTMKDGRVVDEQAAFRGWLENGGGYVALHGADDSMHNWSWYKDMLGGLFVSHPSNAAGFGTNCGSCYWAEVKTEDPTHPTAAGLPARFPVADELYHFDRPPRPFVHPILDLDESTYATAIGVNTAGALENGDHPISWCSNYDGGRLYAQVLGHNWDLPADTAWYQNAVLQGILTTAGLEPANCVTHVEVKTLLANLAAAGAITADAAAHGTALVQSAYDAYATLTDAGYSASLTDIEALRALAQDPASGDAAARAQLLAKAQELKDWMLVLLGSQSTTGGVGGTVPATLSLSLGAPASFGAFTPGVAATYDAGTTANVISTAGDAALSVADPSATATGHLVNGPFSLPQSVQARAISPLGAGGDFAPVGGASSPTPLLTYAAPVSNDPVALSFRQAIGADDALRTGSYGKTLTFTLSTTNP